MHERCQPCAVTLRRVPATRGDGPRHGSRRRPESSGAWYADANHGGTSGGGTDDLAEPGDPADAAPAAPGLGGGIEPPEPLAAATRGLANGGPPPESRADPAPRGGSAGRERGQLSVPVTAERPLS